MNLRVGIIGTGIMGSDHARLLGTVVSGATLVAVSDVDTSRASAVAAGQPVVRVLAEARDEAEAAGLCATIASLVRRELG